MWDSSQLSSEAGITECLKSMKWTSRIEVRKKKFVELKSKKFNL